MRTTATPQEDMTFGVTHASTPWRLTAVKPLPGYQLSVIFIDGTEGIVDMSQLVLSKEAGVFSALRDVNVFNKVYLEYGATTWPGEIDLAPDAMHAAIKRHGKWVLK
jgi:hypothetical protein